MSLAAIGLVLLSAMLHAGWNTLAKQRRDILAFFWALTVASLVIYAPIVALLMARELPDSSVMPYLLGASLAQTVYYVALARAYTTGDLSLVYPVSRGTGVLLAPLLAVITLGERPAPIAWVGIALVVAGIVWIHVPMLRQSARHRSLSGIVSAPALLTGVAIAIYSTIDGAGVQHADPIVYLYFTYALIAVWMAPLALTRRESLQDELKQRWPVIVGGIAVFGTYALILAALRLAPVSYVVPMRSVSIVIGAWLGVRMLGEPFGRTRIAACTVVAAGIVIISVGG